MAKKRERRYSAGEVHFPEPHRRADGEMYARPSGDSPAWLRGYEDGLEGRPASFTGTKIQQTEYMEAYYIGEEERLELDATGSSNT